MKRLTGVNLKIMKLVVLFILVWDFLVLPVFAANFSNDEISISADDKGLISDEKLIGEDDQKLKQQFCLYEFFFESDESEDFVIDKVDNQFLILSNKNSSLEFIQYCHFQTTAFEPPENV